jgi:hypothetical protein
VSGLSYNKLIAEPSIELHVLGPNGEDDKETGLDTLIVLNSDEKRSSVKWAQEYSSVRIPWSLKPREGWTKKSPPNYVERSHALLGQTVDERRVWDVASTAHFLDGGICEKKRTFRVIGRGQAGILAAYAALFEPSIQEVVIVDPPVSHRKGPIFLNVLRVLDIPDALGLLAPRPLTLVNAKDKAFDRTAEIYRLAGAAEKLQRK